MKTLGVCVCGDPLNLHYDSPEEPYLVCPRHGRLTVDVPLTQPEPPISFIDYVPEEEEQEEDETTEEEEEEE